MKPDQGIIDARMEEFRALKPVPGSDELDRLETALFLEETFGVSVTDEDIDGGALDSFDSVRRLLDLKLENA